MKTVHFTLAFLLLYKMVTTVQISKLLSVVLLWEVRGTFSQLRKPKVERYWVHISEKGNREINDCLGQSKMEVNWRRLSKDCLAKQKHGWKFVKMMRKCCLWMSSFGGHVTSFIDASFRVFHEFLWPFLNCKITHFSQKMDLIRTFFDPKTKSCLLKSFVLLTLPSTPWKI